MLVSTLMRWRRGFVQTVADGRDDVSGFLRVNVLVLIRA